MNIVVNKTEKFTILPFTNTFNNIVTGIIEILGEFLKPENQNLQAAFEALGTLLEIESSDIIVGNTKNNVVLDISFCIDINAITEPKSIHNYLNGLAFTVLDKLWVLASMPAVRSNYYDLMGTKIPNINNISSVEIVQVNPGTVFNIAKLPNGKFKCYTRNVIGYENFKENGIRFRRFFNKAVQFIKKHYKEVEYGSFTFRYYNALSHFLEYDHESNDKKIMINDGAGYYHMELLVISDFMSCCQK